VGEGAKEADMSKSQALSILGLFSNLGGVLLLFVFGMPFRIATGGNTVTWITSNVDYQIKKVDDIYSALSWIGLAMTIVGTLLQARAALERK